MFNYGRVAGAISLSKQLRLWWSWKLFFRHPQRTNRHSQGGRRHLGYSPECGMAAQLQKGAISFKRRVNTWGFLVFRSSGFTSKNMVPNKISWEVIRCASAKRTTCCVSRNLWSYAVSPPPATRGLRNAWQDPVDHRQIPPGGGQSYNCSTAQLLPMEWPQFQRLESNQFAVSLPSKESLMTKMFSFIPHLQQLRLKWKMHVHWSGCGRILQNEMCPPWMGLRASACFNRKVVNSRQIAKLSRRVKEVSGDFCKESTLIWNCTNPHGIWDSHWMLGNFCFTHHPKFEHLTWSATTSKQRLGRKSTAAMTCWKRESASAPRETFLHPTNGVGWTCWNYFCIFFCDSLQDFEAEQNWWTQKVDDEWMDHLRPPAFSNFMVFKSYRTTYRMCPPIVSTILLFPSAVMTNIMLFRKELEQQFGVGYCKWTAWLVGFVSTAVGEMTASKWQSIQLNQQNKH